MANVYETLQQMMSPPETPYSNDSVFVHPIHNDGKSVSLPETIDSDLQLGSDDTTETRGTYDVLLRPTTPFAKRVAVTWHTHFSVDKLYIKETQELIGGMNGTKHTFSPEVRCESFQTKLLESWDEIGNGIGTDEFIDKYHYVSPTPLRKLNKSPTVLQAVNLYVMASPVMALLLPIISLIFPFLILRMRGVVINASTYSSILSGIISRHPVGQVFYNMGSVSWDKVVYLLFTVGMYFVQIYQNVKSCIRYYHNITHIHEVIRTFREFAVHSQTNVSAMTKLCADMKSVNYTELVAQASRHQVILGSFAECAETVGIGCGGGGWGGITQYLHTGDVMRLFYDMRTNQEFIDAVQYMIGYNGYIENIISLGESLATGGITMCTIDETKKLSFDGGYHPLVETLTENGATPTSNTEMMIVKNSYSLSKNMVISGPNASGKTTLLKSTILNAILCQQIGGGFFNECVTPCFNMFHCYLNIPDTSDRDSLFQAEARRCKDMLGVIEDMGHEAKHLCVMDELFSGTNPEEATAGSYSFMEYLAGLRGVSFVMTTHYMKLCKMIKRDKKCAKNYNMCSSVDGIGVKYSYKISGGISKIKGGASVIRKMGFPERIINTMSNLLHPRPNPQMRLNTM